MKEFRKIFQMVTFCTNRPMQQGINDFLQQREGYLELSDFYQKKRDCFLSAIGESKFKPIAAAGSYFQLLHCGDIFEGSDFEIASQIANEHKVCGIPISVFYTSGRDDGYVRFCFAKTEETLKDAGKKLSQI